MLLTVSLHVMLHMPILQRKRENSSLSIRQKFITTRPEPNLEHDHNMDPPNGRSLSYVAYYITMRARMQAPPRMQCNATS